MGIPICGDPDCNACPTPEELQLIADAAEAVDVIGDDDLEMFAAKQAKCSHGNVLEHCAQCDSDFQQEVDSSVLNQIPPDPSRDDIFEGYGDYDK